MKKLDILLNHYLFYLIIYLTIMSTGFTVACILFLILRRKNE